MITDNYFDKIELQRSDYLRMVCEYLEIKRSCIGKTVIDVGCGNGIMTCFVADMMPDSTVVGIDIDEKAVAEANELAGKLGLTNVSFEVASLDKYDRSFETVISARTAAEYSARYDKGIENAAGEPLRKQLTNYKKIFRKYAKAISKLASVNVFTFEQLTFNGGYLGFCSAMNDNGLLIDPSTHIITKDPGAAAGTNPDLQIAIFSKSQSVSDEELIRMVVSDILLTNVVNEDMTVYNSFDADIFLWGKNSRLIEGYIYYDEDKLGKYRIGKQAVYGSPADPDHIYLRIVLYAEGRDDLMVLDAGRKQEILDTLHGDVKEHRSEGIIAKKCFV